MTGPSAPDPRRKEMTLYEHRVGAMADALHETCRLEWQAIAVVDPDRLITQHGTDAHYGQAHDLVRRLDRVGYCG